MLATIRYIWRAQWSTLAQSVCVLWCLDFKYGLTSAYSLRWLGSMTWRAVTLAQSVCVLWCLDFEYGLTSAKSLRW